MAPVSPGKSPLPHHAANPPPPLPPPPYCHTPLAKGWVHPPVQLQGAVTFWLCFRLCFGKCVHARSVFHKDGHNSMHNPNAKICTLMTPITHMHARVCTLTCIMSWYYCICTAAVAAAAAATPQRGSSCGGVQGSGDRADSDADPFLMPSKAQNMVDEMRQAVAGLPSHMDALCKAIAARGGPKVPPGSPYTLHITCRQTRPHESKVLSSSNAFWSAYTNTGTESLCHRLLKFDGQTVIAAVWHMCSAFLAG